MTPPCHEISVLFSLQPCGKVTSHSCREAIEPFAMPMPLEGSCQCGSQTSKAYEKISSGGVEFKLQSSSTVRPEGERNFHDHYGKTSLEGWHKKHGLFVD